MAEQIEIPIHDISRSIPSLNRNEFLNSIMMDEREITKNSQLQGPKIPRVPRMLTVIDANKECYDPLMVSIGPYHHGKTELQEMENIKPMIARQFFQWIGGTYSIEQLYDKVAEVSKDARQYYAEGSTEDFNDSQFIQMMFLDGCFILEFIYCLLHRAEHLKMNSHVAALISRDLFLLENQLPFPVLNSLMSLRFRKEDKEPGEDKEDEGMKLLKEFFERIRAMPPRRESCRERVSKFFRRTPVLRGLTYSEDVGTIDHPIHLLELFRFQFIGGEMISSDNVPPNWYPHRYHPASELRNVGVHFKPSKTSSFTDVFFKPTVLAGRLRIPPLTIHDSTKPLLLNLVAFEACLGAPDKLWITSYICFMDSLIDHPEDVRELRSQGILFNTLGSDQQVAELFNEIANYLVPHPYAYIQAKRGIESHCRNTFKRWVLHYKGPFYGFVLKYSFLYGLIVGAIKAYVAELPKEPIYGFCRLPDINGTYFP